MTNHLAALVDAAVFARKGNSSDVKTKEAREVLLVIAPGTYPTAEASVGLSALFASMRDCDPKLDDAELLEDARRGAKLSHFLALPPFDVSRWRTHL